MKCSQIYILFYEICCISGLTWFILKAKQKHHQAFLMSLWWFDVHPMTHLSALIQHNRHHPSWLSSPSGSLLSIRFTETLQPHGSQQLLPTGLFLLFLFLLLQLPHQNGVQLPRLHLWALPLSALQPPRLLLPAPLLARPAGELLCPWIRTLLQPDRLPVCVSHGGELF